MDAFGQRKGHVEHLVVDAGGFIRNVKIKNFGTTIYTLPEVVAEIRDRATKERLAVLPYEIIFREPSADLIKMVSDFAKKTGDYASLSATDIKVIALTLLLEKENVGLDHIHHEPMKQKTIIHKATPTTVGEEVRQAAHTPGFFIPKHDRGSSSAKSSVLSPDTESVEQSVLSEVTSNALAAEDDWEDDVDEADLVEGMNCVTLNDIHEQSARNGSDPVKEGDDSETSDSDDDAGWITPQNIKAVYKQMGLEKEEPRPSNKVGCLTGDFSMQNVILQMGMQVIGPDGMVIKTLRTYVFRCFACYKVCHNMTKKFCPSCGNQTLKRVCVTVDKNGQPKYHISTRRPLNIRGTKFSLPLPVGGKHAVNPVLCEDQPVGQFRAPKKTLKKLNVFDPDYVGGDSPFLTNDLTSRASLLGRRGMDTFCETKPWMTKNPNACRRPRK